MATTARNWKTYTASNGDREIEVRASSIAHAAITGRGLLRSVAVTIDGQTVPVEAIEVYLAQREAYWEQREQRGATTTDTGALYVA